MATNRFLIVGKYAVGSNRGLHDIDLVDTRVRGGGIKEELVTDFKGSYPQVRWFHDIGHYDGTPFPGATAVLVDLPATLLEVNGGIFNKKQIDSIVKHHLSFGIYPVIRFYCTNTGLVKHEDVSDSTVFLGTWDVPDGETCPDEDGTVLCTLITATTTTTTTLGLEWEMSDYLRDFDDDSRYLTSYQSHLTYNAYNITFDDPVGGAEKVSLEIRTRNQGFTARWWTNPNGPTPDPGGETMESVAIGSWENVESTKVTGPWSQAELTLLQVFMEESTDMGPLDLGGVRFNLYDAGDVLLESVYANGFYYNCSNVWREPKLDTAPPGYQWVDRTAEANWTAGTGWAWNAGGWWDVTSIGTGNLVVNGTWIEGVRPLALRLTHDGTPGGLLMVKDAEFGQAFGQHWNYVSNEVIDLAEVDDWVLDMERIQWSTQPSCMVTKIEVLEPI